MKPSRRPVLSAIDEHIKEDNHTSEHHVLDDKTKRACVADELRNMLTLPPEVQSASGLDDVRAAATRLNLIAKRPSIVAWKHKYLETPCPRLSAAIETDGDNPVVDSEHLTQARKQRINESLAWLRNELEDMRLQDQSLARQLLSIRHDMQELKLEFSCEEHQEMVEEVTDDLQDIHDLHEISDIPLESVHSDNPLKHLGVTHMNITNRRFSIY